MAISARFVADFDQFVGETKRADAALHGLGTSATKVTTEAQSSFAGMGSSMRSLAGAFGVALSVGAVVAFGKSVFAAASDIGDMSLKLGISTDAVQGFKFAAEQAGSTLDAVGIAITKMNVNLSEGSKGTVAALKAAGLEFAHIRQMKPEDAFLAITDAVAKIPDPMLRSEVALQLFGKSAADLLPAILSNFRQTADGASKMSDETIASLKRAEDAWKSVWSEIVIVSGGLLADAMDSMSDIARLVAMNLGLAAGEAKTFKNDIELLPPVLGLTAEELKALDKAAADAAKATEDAAIAAAKLEAAWKKANETAVVKMESDVRNQEGMLLMNEAIATQERALLNLEGVWLQNRDAGMLAAEASNAVWDSIKDKSNATLQGLADKAQAAYERATLNSGEFSEAAIAHFAAVAAAAASTAAGIAAVGAQLAGLTITGGASPLNATGTVSFGPNGEMISGGGSQFVPGSNVTSFGGDLSSGSAGGGANGIMVHPSIAGTGRLGAQPPTQNITVNAQGGFYDTPESVQRLAAKVGDAVTSSLRSQGRQV